MAGEIVGSAAYFQWTYATSKGGAAAGTVTLQSRYRTFSFKRNMETVDISAGADTERAYLSTLRDKTADMTILYQGTAGSATHRGCGVGNWGSLIWGPEGTATGQPKYGFVGCITDFSVEYQFDGEVEFDISWQGSGTMLFDFEGSGSVW